MTDTYAIGDIHGRFDLLTRALDAIEERSKHRARVIFLGDYIDRGPQSKEVIETLMRGPPRGGDEWICLKGNHEDMMVQTLAVPLDPNWWIGNGGAATLTSFGGSIPPDVLTWCNGLPVFHETEHHFFVHAGVRPDVKLADQSAEEMMWIRNQFLRHEEPFEKHIVHGHTPRRTAELLPNRTNLDSGAFMTGCLSIGKFDLTKPGGTSGLIVIEKGT